MDHTYKSDKPYATLMRGRPDDPKSHQHIAVYSKAELEAFRKKGWLHSKEFLLRVGRARGESD